MELLDIRTPSITRTQFASLTSKQVWEEKIRKGSHLYPALEYLTVKHEVRPCMIAHGVDPNSLDDYMRKLSRDGLLVVPVAKEAAQNGAGFGHVQGAYTGGPFTYRCVVTKSIDLADQFADAHNRGDDLAIGKLLGFPERSSIFFDEVWKKGYFDPIWQQAENTTEPETLKNRRDFEDPMGNVEKKLIRFKSSDENWKILSTFRYIGIRVISHFAHSFDDKESIQVADNWIQLAKDLNLLGLQETMEILQLPFEWNCLKGFAEINTPVFKIVTSSVPCYPNHIIQQESDFYPAEAPNGIQFPWRNPLFAPKK
jgi:hypothetical protein